MRTTDSEVRGREDGDRDLHEVIRAEFARLDLDDAELADRLERYAVAAAAGLDPEAAAAVCLAVVEGAHEVVGSAPAVEGPTVGELSVGRLLAAALRPRRTTAAGR